MSKIEKAFLVGLCLTKETSANQSRPPKAALRHQIQEELDELQRLAESAGAEVVGRFVQERAGPDPATFIGEGKVDELEGIIQRDGVNLVIFDEELSPAQNRNLEQRLKCKVLDRTGLILDIFASRAHTKEGKVQVELAQMQYLYPRLVGMWMHFSRQQGGIGMRGPGETQLEVDRRKVQERISFLEKKLEKIRQDRDQQRQKRREASLPIVSLVGYTNAGKSTLMNALAGVEEYTDDRLFATLDPVTRRVDLGHHLMILLNDTVGLIQKLPHELVASFRATFEEIKESDLLMHVVDASHPNAHDQELAVLAVLEDYECTHLPCITVYNKMDCLPEVPSPMMPDAYFVSASQGQGLEQLKAAMTRHLATLWPLKHVRLSLAQGKLRAQLFREGAVIRETAGEDFMELELRLPKEKLYLLDETAPVP